MNSLDEKYSKSVIFWLYENNSVLKTDLQRVVKNLYSLNSLLEKLEQDELIQIEKKPFGKNITEISLTPKGRDVAEHLIKLDAISKGKKLPSRYSLSLESNCIVNRLSEGTKTEILIRRHRDMIFALQPG